MRSHFRANRTASQGIEQTVATAVFSAAPHISIQNIALDQLGFAPGSRRRIRRESIQNLAVRIQASGRLQSLLVVPGENAQFYVVAGERRFAALQLLARERRIPPTLPVPCRVIDGKPFTEARPPANFNSIDKSEAQRRKRFLALRNRCPGLLTGSELAARQYYT